MADIIDDDELELAASSASGRDDLDDAEQQAQLGDNNEAEDRLTLGTAHRPNQVVRDDPLEGAPGVDGEQPIVGASASSGSLGSIPLSHADGSPEVGEAGATGGTFAASASALSDGAASPPLAAAGNNSAVEGYDGAGNDDGAANGQPAANPNDTQFSEADALPADAGTGGNADGDGESQLAAASSDGDASDADTGNSGSSQDTQGSASSQQLEGDRGWHHLARTRHAQALLLWVLLGESGRAIMAERAHVMAQ